MRSCLEYKIEGFYMPNYLIEILIYGYTDTFLPMSIFKDGKSYIFSHDLRNLNKINAKEMNINQKLNLLKSIIEILDKNNNYLIPESLYKIDLDKIYFNQVNARERKIRLLYYPDLKKRSFWEKLKKLTLELFCEEDIDNASMEEKELLKGLLSLIESKNINKINRYIDKKLIRLEKK